MFRNRLATMILAVCLGSATGCCTFCERPFFPRLFPGRFGRCCEATEVGMSPSCCEGPLLDGGFSGGFSGGCAGGCGGGSAPLMAGPGPMLVPPGATTEPMPNMPSLAPTPRLVPQPQSQPTPYQP